MNNNPTPPVPSPVLPWMRQAARAQLTLFATEMTQLWTKQGMALYLLPVSETGITTFAQLIANHAPKSPPPSDEAREIAKQLDTIKISRAQGDQGYAYDQAALARAITFLRNLSGSSAPVATAEIGTLEIPTIAEEPFKRGCDSVQGAIGYLAAEISRLRSLLINAAPVSCDGTLRRLAREVCDDWNTPASQESLTSFTKKVASLSAHLDATPEAGRGGENSIVEEQARAWCTVASKFDCGPEGKSYCEHVCAEIDRLRGIEAASTPHPASESASTYEVLRAATEEAECAIAVKDDEDRVLMRIDWLADARRCLDAGVPIKPNRDSLRTARRYVEDRLTRGAGPMDRHDIEFLASAFSALASESPPPPVNAKLVESLKELSNIVLNGMTADYDEMTAALGRARAALTEAGVKIP